MSDGKHISRGSRYVPAAGRHAFTRLYDPVLALTMRERTFRARLQNAVLEELPHTGTIVDVGAGTGTFAITLAAAAPDATIIAIDGDPDVLRIAQAKDGASRVQWKHGFAQELPLPDVSADRVSMSLVLHHLDPAAKRAALSEALRILRPGGRLHIADWGQPQDPLMRAAFLAIQAIDGRVSTRDHAAGRIPALVVAVGFAQVRRDDRLRTPFGSLELVSAAHLGGSAGTFQ